MKKTIQAQAELIAKMAQQREEQMKLLKGYQLTR